MINIAAMWLPEYQQQNYRSVLDAVSRPGSCKPLYFDAGDRAFIALLACLLDTSVTLADPHTLVNQDSLPLLQASMDRPEQADFIVCDGRAALDFIPKLGTLPSPELSATVVLLVEKIHDALVGDIEDMGAKGTSEKAMSDVNLQLSGPGVNGTHQCAIKGLAEHWLAAREEWVSSFPLGIDILLVDDTRVMALPRTTKVEIV